MDFAKHIKPLANESDWAIWKRKIRDLLDYHEGALDILDKKLEKPVQSPDDKDSTRYNKQLAFYRKANSVVKSTIASTVTDSVYQKIMDNESGSDMWEALKNQFEATSKDQLFKVCTEFFAFMWNTGEDVSTHIAKLKSLWNDLNNGLKEKNENPLPDLLLMCKILFVLPSTFENFKASWMLLSKDSTKTFDELSIQLCTFERNMRKTNDCKSPSEALIVKDNKKKDNDKYKNLAKKDDVCNYCRRRGHWVRTCRKWISDGRPKRKDEFKSAASNSAEHVGLVSVCNETFSATEKSRSNSWWIDNGATKHITNCYEWFIDFEKFQNMHTVIAAGEEPLEAIGSGRIEVSLIVEGKRKTNILNNVWYVPKISRNLFSVLAAHDLNPRSIFESSVNKCCFKINGVTVMEGFREQRGSLYKANIETIIPQCPPQINSVISNESLLQLYHERWGHQDKGHVKKKLEQELGIKVKLERNICEPCVYGKTHRLPFGTNVKASSAGELISTDIVGPFDESFSKKRYLVVFKDSYTKFRYGYVVAKKSEASDCLVQMLAHAKQQGHSVKMLLSDNGGEYDNDKVRKILQQHGVSQRLTAPYTPQQNGLCERENRTIIEMARTFKYSNSEINFPAAIWAELVSTAVYILNRTADSVGGLSPFELWLQKKPRIKHLRIIGSSCYFHIPKENRKKMDKKATKGVLVGYDGDERYRIYVKESNQVFLSRDVIFHERLHECFEKVEVPTPKRRTEENENEDDLSNESSEESSSKSNLEPQLEQRSDTRILRNRSTIKAPTYYDDFVMTMIAEEDPQSFQEAIHTAFCLLTEEDPKTYEEAIKRGWSEAINRELNAHKDFKTWTPVEDIPSNSKPIETKWVFTTKNDGTKKARLVAKGFQADNIHETLYSPVARITTIKLAFSMALQQENWHIKQLDVPTAFLNGYLENDIYIYKPKGVNEKSEILKLQRALYGLREAPKCWNKRFTSFAEDRGFTRSNFDACLFFRKGVWMILWVDDILVFGEESEVGKTIEDLEKEFKARHLENLKSFIGIEMNVSEETIEISQKQLIEKIINRFRLAEAKPSPTPMEEKLEVQESEEVIKVPYRELVGSLIYLSQISRPDITFATSFLSRFLDRPTKTLWNAAKRVVRYLKGTMDQKLIYRKTWDIEDTRKIVCYSDADWGGDRIDRKSCSGMAAYHCGNIISWRSRKQQSVALSSSEAEYVASNLAGTELLHLKGLLSEFCQCEGMDIKCTLLVDNQGALSMIKNFENTCRSKHIDIKFHFIKDIVSKNLISIEYVNTAANIADIFTKALNNYKFTSFRSQLCLY